MFERGREIKKERERERKRERERERESEVTFVVCIVDCVFYDKVFYTFTLLTLHHPQALPRQQTPVVVMESTAVAETQTCVLLPIQVWPAHRTSISVLIPTAPLMVHQKILETP